MKLTSVMTVKTTPVSKNTVFGVALSRKSIEDLTKAAEFRDKLKECQQLLKELEGTSGSVEFGALLKLTARRLAELKSQRNPEIILGEKVLN